VSDEIELAVAVEVRRLKEKPPTAESSKRDAGSAPASAMNRCSFV